MKVEKDTYLYGRRIEWFHHESGAEYGYTTPQIDSFAVIHPVNEQEGRKYPLYVVFHSAGHDLYSAIGCIPYDGNHDIHHVRDDMYALFLDCRFNATNDWWWGGNDALNSVNQDKHGTALQPVERRCIGTVEHVINAYPIDKNAVFAAGNSMGGSGALGIAFRRGDIFASIIANVPAGVEHITDRCCLGKEKPEGFSIPEPPFVVDYSAQNDDWSTGHEKLYAGMKAEKYAIIGYFGTYGHANNLSEIRKVNDLVLTFDALTIRKNEAYPAFTNASTDDMIPWPDNRSSNIAGQVNAFFRFKNIADTSDKFAIDLWLANTDEIQTSRTLPTESTADVTLRRIQNFRSSPSEKILCTFGDASVTVTADETGHITVPALKVTQNHQILTLSRA